MKVGVVGVGEMGLAMAGHLIAKEHTVSAFDVNAERLSVAERRGASVAESLPEIARQAEVFVVIVATDKQSREVTETLAEHASPG